MTKYFNIEGTCEWAQVTPGNEAAKYDFNGMDPEKLTLEQKELKIDLIMDDENIAIFKGSGSRKEIKDGNKVTLNRDPTRLLGEDELGYPMVVLGEDGREEYTGKIGNGSKVRVNFVVYNTQKGTGTRLEGVRILELVPYEPKGAEWKEDETAELPF